MFSHFGAVYGEGSNNCLSCPRIKTMPGAISGTTSAGCRSRMREGIFNPRTAPILLCLPRRALRFFLLFLYQLLDFPDFGHAFFGPGVLKQVFAGEGGFWQDFAF